MKTLNLSLTVSPDKTSIFIIHTPGNGKRTEIIRSIHVFTSAELELKKVWMQKKIDDYNQAGII